MTAKSISSSAGSPGGPRRPQAPHRLLGMAQRSRNGNGHGSATLRPQVTDAIVEAAFEELAEKGFVGLSMDGVARRAGVGKGALYRRWPSKVEMTVGVLELLSVTDEPATDTGSLRGDVHALLVDVHNWLSDPQIRHIYPDLLAEAQRNPALAEALMDHVGRPRRLRAQTILDRAASRGELAGNSDQDLILDMFGAMVFWRLIALRRPITPAHLEKVTELILHLAHGSSACRSREVESSA